MANRCKSPSGSRATHRALVAATVSLTAVVASTPAVFAIPAIDSIPTQTHAAPAAPLALLVGEKGASAPASASHTTAASAPRAAAVEKIDEPIVASFQMRDGQSGAWAASGDHSRGEDIPFSVTGALPTNLAERAALPYWFVVESEEGLTVANVAPQVKVVHANGSTDDVTQQLTVSTSAHGIVAGSADIRQSIAGLAPTDTLVLTYTMRLNARSRLGLARGNASFAHIEYRSAAGTTPAAQQSPQAVVTQGWPSAAGTLHAASLAGERAASSPAAATAAASAQRATAAASASQATASLAGERVAAAPAAATAAASAQRATVAAAPTAATAAAATSASTRATAAAAPAAATSAPAARAQRATAAAATSASTRAATATAASACAVIPTSAPAARTQRATAADPAPAARTPRATAADPAPAACALRAAAAGADLSTRESNLTRSPEIQAIVYSYELEAHVVAKGTDTPLADARLALQNATGDWYAGDADWSQSRVQATVVTTDANGTASFVGVGSGTYRLVELAAPDSYQVADPVDVTIEATIVPSDAPAPRATGAAGASTITATSHLARAVTANATTGLVSATIENTPLTPGAVPGTTNPSVGDGSQTSGTNRNNGASPTSNGAGNTTPQRSPKTGDLVYPIGVVTLISVLTLLGGLAIRRGAGRKERQACKSSAGTGPTDKEEGNAHE